MLAACDMGRRQRRSREAGFSVLEAIVALTIMALALTVFQMGLRTGTNAIRSAELQRAALSVARSELEKVSVVTPLEDGLRSGRTADGLDWRLELTQHLRGNPGQAPDRILPYRVSVIVTWQDPLASEPRSLTLTSIKLKRGL